MRARTREGNLVAHRPDELQKRFEVLRSLQLTQRRRIRRRQIEHASVGPARHAQVALRIGIGGAVDRHLAVLAKVHEDRRVRGRALQPLGDGDGAVVVEPETVDQRLMLRIAEDARLRISRLRTERDRSDFDESESESEEGDGNVRPKSWRRAADGGRQNLAIVSTSSGTSSKRSTFRTMSSCAASASSANSSLRIRRYIARLAPGARGRADRPRWHARAAGSRARAPGRDPFRSWPCAAA